MVGLIDETWQQKLEKLRTFSFDCTALNNVTCVHRRISKITYAEMQLVTDWLFLVEIFIDQIL